MEENKIFPEKHLLFNILFPWNREIIFVQQELFECLEDREEQRDLTLSRSGSGLSMLDMPASEEPTVMEELVEERVVLEPHHLNEEGREEYKLFGWLD